MNFKTTKNFWYVRLLRELEEYNRENVDIYDYFILANICYPITEYIVKSFEFSQPKQKEQNLNKEFQAKLDYIYNRKFHFNDLKHMNQMSNEKKWLNLLEEDWKQLSIQLKMNTKLLLKSYNSRHAITEETVINNFSSILSDPEYDKLISSLDSLKKVSLEPLIDLVQIASEVATSQLNNSVMGIIESLTRLEIPMCEVGGKIEDKL